MKLLRLQARHFKNYEELSFEYQDSEATFFLGKNGQGKTNFLEALQLLAFGKSFRGNALSSFFSWQQESAGETPFFEVLGEFEKDDGSRFELLIRAQKQRGLEKKIFLNEGEVSLDEMVGRIPMVCFIPDDLQVLFSSPSRRRKEINRILCQSHTEYFSALKQYHQVLQQRNGLLKMISKRKAQTSDLQYWDEKLLSSGSVLYALRRKFLLEQQETFQSCYRELSQKDHKLELRWKWETEQIDEQLLYQSFSETLYAHREADLRLGSSTVGPHRDDFLFLLNGHEMDTASSQGECRSAVLSLKYAELLWVETMKHEKALFLLDDVFSELDTDRQKKLLELITGRQSFFTSTHLEFTPDEVCIVQVNDGSLISSEDA